MKRICRAPCGLFLMLAFSAQAQTSQPLLAGGNEGISIDYLRVGISLAFCLALAVGAAALLRKRSVRSIMHRGKEGRRIKIIETSRLSPRVQLHLIEVDGQSMLVTSGPQNTYTVVLQRTRNENDQHTTE